DLPEKEYKKALEKLKGKKKKSYWDKITSHFNKEEKDEKKKSKLKTLHFHQENVHDFAWFADPRWIVRKGELYLADSTREVTLWSMYLPKNAELWENSIEYLHDSGYWYSKFLGDYPYNHITAVDGDLSAGGGMEYPNITVISTTKSKHRLENVIMHEVGHNWFYGILGTNERDHVWMDEGLNEFNNIRYWEKKYGKLGRKYILNEKTQQKLGPFSIAKNLKYGFMEYVGYTSWIKLGDEEPLETSSNSFKRRTNYWLSYSKPFVYSWHLLQYLGEDNIDLIMQDFYNDWKFKHPYPEDFFHYFPKHSDKDLRWYTHDVFYRTGKVDYAVKLKKNQAIFTNKGTLSVPFQAAYYDAGGNEIQRNWVEVVDNSKLIDLPEGTKSILIDPDETLPDVNRSNNATHKPFTFTWVFDQPQYYKREIFWLPWFFSYNQYNGFTPGIRFYHGFVPGYDYGIGVLPLWDSKNDQLAGKVSFSRYLYDFGEFYQTSFSGDISKIAGRSGLHLKFKGKRKEHLQRYPVWTTTAAIDMHSIKTEAVDTTYYSPGEVATAYGEISFYHRPDPQNRVTIKSGIKTGFINAEFVRLHFQVNHSFKFSKKTSTKTRLWAGGFLTSTNLPPQYRTYLSGGVDPDFRQNFVINRTPTINDVSIGTKQYITDGPSLHGVVIQGGKSSGIHEWVIAGNFEMTFPKLPGRPFADAAFVLGGEPYVNCGWKYSMGPFALIVPIYQSWSDTPIIDSLEMAGKRVRISISVKSYNYRDML
ncbi:MAG: M1 family aminopeptidase, partial [Candidatus Marinimicrobia bacterium]|nr:M1 family aminopeptidase [Candidatus Neomarinimicrobiota bacterium]